MRRLVEPNVPELVQKPSIGAAAPRMFAVAAAVNDDVILAQCLARSPEIESGALPLTCYRAYPTAGTAYNQGLDDADADYVIFAHQDVFLPQGSVERLTRSINELNATAPDWAVAGVVGLDVDGALKGETWCSGNNCVIGDGSALPARAISLDELVIVVRRSSGLRFDPKLPSFHLYAADIILIAEAAGLSTWIIHLPVVHHSRPVVNLGGGYAHAWHYMRRKWRLKLPVQNLVCAITASPFTLWNKDLRIRIRNRWNDSRGHAVGDPAQIAERLGFQARATGETSERA
jgi:hypothetical protein